MNITDKFGCISAMLVGAMMLSGCSSLLQGKQYEFPQANEPSATLRTHYIRGTDLHLMNFNDKGCYAGYTPLPYVNGSIGSPVGVNKKLVVTYRLESAGKVCQIPFSFTPEAGATYTVTTGSWSETKTGIVPFFTAEQQYCGIALTKRADGAEQVEPIEKLRIDTGVICHKFVK